MDHRQGLRRSGQRRPRDRNTAGLGGPDGGVRRHRVASGDEDGVDQHAVGRPVVVAALAVAIHQPQQVGPTITIGVDELAAGPTIPIELVERRLLIGRTPPSELVDHIGGVGLVEDQDQHDSAVRLRRGRVHLELDERRDVQESCGNLTESGGLLDGQLVDPGQQIDLNPQRIDAKIVRPVVSNHQRDKVIGRGERAQAETPQREGGNRIFEGVINPIPIQVANHVFHLVWDRVLVGVVNDGDGVDRVGPRIQRIGDHLDPDRRLRIEGPIEIEAEHGIREAGMDIVHPRQHIAERPVLRIQEEGVEVDGQWIAIRHEERQGFRRDRHRAQGPRAVARHTHLEFTGSQVNRGISRDVGGGRLHGIGTRDQTMLCGNLQAPPALRAVQQDRPFRRPVDATGDTHGQQDRLTSIEVSANHRGTGRG